jgi:hypothetical protein
MKYIFFLIIGILFTNCKKQEAENNFDEIIHYQITDEGALKNKESERFFTIFTSLEKHKLDLQSFEKEIIDFGFTKHTFQKEKTKAINDFITNKIYYKENFTACVPYYRDILILKSKGKTIAILKICFECNMTEYYGKINTNFTEIKNEEDFNNYFRDFNQLYFILTGKEYKTNL